MAYVVQYWPKLTTPTRMGILALAGLVRLFHQNLPEMNRIRLVILAATIPVVNLANQDHLSTIAQALHP